jgi:NADH-quinone oxidoreductase subunit J
VAVWIRRVLYAILWLGFMFLGVAGLFFTLGSPFVGAMQIIIYVGGITVIMVFAVMLCTSVGAPVVTRMRLSRHPAKTTLAVVVPLLFGIALVAAVRGTDFGVPGSTTPDQWRVEGVGELFLGEFNVAFESLSLALLVAIVGAVLIARREE